MLDLEITTTTRTEPGEIASEAASINRCMPRVEQCEMLRELEVMQFIRGILARDLEHFSRLETVL